MFVWLVYIFVRVERWVTGSFYSIWCLLKYREIIYQSSKLLVSLSSTFTNFSSVCRIRAQELSFEILLKFSWVLWNVGNVLNSVIETIPSLMWVFGLEAHIWLSSGQWGTNVSLIKVGLFWKGFFRLPRTVYSYPSYPYIMVWGCFSSLTPF